MAEGTPLAEGTGKQASVEGESRTSPEPSSIDRRGDLRALADAPLLAPLAACALLLELILGRLMSIDLRWCDGDTAMAIELAASLRPVKNVVVIAGTAAAAEALFRFSRMADGGGFWFRLCLSLVSGFALPVGLIALSTQAARLGSGLVAIGLLSSLTVGGLLGIGALRYRSETASWISITAGSVCVFSTLALIGALFRQQALALGLTPVSSFAKHAGELGFCSVPLLAAISMLDAGRLKHARRMALFGISTLVAVFAIGWWIQGSHPHAATLMYSGFRLSALRESQSVLYAIPLSAAAAVVLTGLVTQERPKVQLAWATLLWTAAGYAPRNVVGIVSMLAALMLFARVAQVTHPAGRKRALVLWGEPSR